MKCKDLVRLLNVSPSYACEILKGIKGVSEENMLKIKKQYPNIEFKISSKPRYKIVLDKENK